MWKAASAILRKPHSGMYSGISGEEAVRRIIGLNSAAQASGVTIHIADHLAELAPCLSMLDIEKR